MTQLTQASRQWATRPNDERFVNLHELAAKVAHQKDMSYAKIVASRDISVVENPDDDQGIQISVARTDGKASKPVNATHWSFGQLASLSGAPAGYLRKLPPKIVAANMNYGLNFERTGLGIYQKRPIEDMSLLTTREPDGTWTLRAANGPKYGRVWNQDIVESLIALYGDGTSGRFRIPGEFKQKVEITKANTTLYCGDRNMFAFLADEENRIEIPNRRDGKSGSLARGFFVGNSEVGSDPLSGDFFLFDEVCCNRIVWGAADIHRLRIRHTASAPHRWAEEIQPILKEYAESSAKTVTETIKAAQQRKVTDDLDKFLASLNFGNQQVRQLKAVHEAEEGRPIETLWDVTTAITAHAKSIEHQDARIEMERIGGRVLDLVAA